MIVGFKIAAKFLNIFLSRCDSGMSYVNHDAWTIDENDQIKTLE